MSRDRRAPCAAASRSSARPSPTSTASCRTSRRSCCTPRRRATRSPTPGSALSRRRRRVQRRALDGLGDRRVHGHPPALHRRHADRRLLVHRARAARRGRDRRRARRRRAHHARRERRVARRHAGHALRRRRVPACSSSSPFGLAGPPTGYALAATRHMHEYGTTSEQLAELAVSTRKWAQLNPRAIMRDPLTVDDVLVVAHDLVAAPSARLLPGHRRGRRRRAHVGGTGARPAEAAGLRARHRRGVDARDREPDAELRLLGRGEDRQRRRVRHGGRDARRHRRRDVLRRLHHRAGDGPRSDRVLQAGRGRARSSRAAARRRAARSR